MSTRRTVLTLISVALLLSAGCTGIPPVFIGLAPTPEVPDTATPESEGLAITTDSESGSEPADGASSSIDKVAEHLHKGNAAFDSADYPTAIEHFGRALAIEPENGSIHFLIGSAYFELGDHEQAIQSFDAAVEWGGETSEVLAMRGQSHRALGRYDEALRDLSTAIELHPDDSALLLERGRTHLEADDLPSAISDLDTAIALDETDAVAHFLRGLAFAFGDDFDSALEDLDRALELDDGYVDAYYHRSSISRFVGDFEAAEAYRSQAISVDPAVVYRFFKFPAIAYPAMQLDDENLVGFRSHAFHFDTAIALYFQHPPDWQIGYASDSGVSGWLLADMDPNDAFLYRNVTGEEVILILLGGTADVTDFDLRDTVLEGVEYHSDADIIEAVEDDRQMAYATYTFPESSDILISAGVLVGQMLFIVRGHIPAEKKSAALAGVETMLRTLNGIPVDDVNFVDTNLWGTRVEGRLEADTQREGYLPIASTSEWTIEGTEGQAFDITVEPMESDITLILDVLDGDRQSLLADGPHVFSGEIVVETPPLPEDGSFTVQIYALSQWYGWYRVAME